MLFILALPCSLASSHIKVTLCTTSRFADFGDVSNGTFTILYQSLFFSWKRDDLEPSSGGTVQDTVKTLKHFVYFPEGRRDGEREWSRAAAVRSGQNPILLMPVVLEAEERKHTLTQPSTLSRAEEKSSPTVHRGTLKVQPLKRLISVLFGLGEVFSVFKASDG